MSRKKITHSTLWQFMSQGISMFIGIISVKFVVMALSKDLVGNYQTVYSYLQIFGILADFGLYAVSVRELSRSNDRSVTFAALFVLRALITTISLGSAILIAWILPIFRGTPLPLGITIAALVPCFTLLSGMFRTVFQVEYRMEKVFVAEVIGKSIPVLLMACLIVAHVRLSESESVYLLLLLFGGAGSLVLFLLSMWFATHLRLDINCSSMASIKEESDYDGYSGQASLPVVCTALSGLWQGLLDRSDAARMFRSSVRTEATRILKIAMPYGFVFLMTTIYRQSDVTLIALLRPYDYEMQNAHYGIVMRLAEVGFLIPTFILNSVLPSIGSLESQVKRADELFSRVFMALITICSTISLFAYFFASPIIRLIASEAYIHTDHSFGSDTALMIMSFPMFLSGIVSYFFYLLMLSHRWRPLLLVTGIASIFSLIINLWLIPLFGFVGAAMTLTITHLLVVIGLSWFATPLCLASIGSSEDFDESGVPTIGSGGQVGLPWFARGYIKEGTGFASSLFRFAQWFAYSAILGGILWIGAPYLTSTLRTILLGGICLILALALAWILGLIPRDRILGD